MVASQLMKVAGFIHSTLSGYSTPAWAAAIAGVFVITSVSLSMFLLFHHLSAYKNPEEQKFLVGVILMVPCYAVESCAWSLIADQQQHQGIPTPQRHREAPTPKSGALVPIGQAPGEPSTGKSCTMNGHNCIVEWSFPCSIRAFRILVLETSDIVPRKTTLDRACGKAALESGAPTPRAVSLSIRI